jgi:basic amino acid/polyamine antiporter, APA family
MADDLTFARKASGLVRGLSTLDAFGIGIMITMPLFTIWQMIYLGYGLFPGGEIIIAIIISVVLIGVSSPIVWGMLGGTMPRSGGEYVFNSRILHPSIATGASMAQFFAGFYWQFLISTCFAVPGLSLLFTMLGWDSAATWVFGKWGTFTVATAIIILSFLTIAWGMRIYKAIQKPMIVLAIGGPIVLCIAMTIASHGDFVSYWNKISAQYGSVDYSHFVAAVGAGYGRPVPATWNWSETFGLMSGVFVLFVYNYFIVYVGGEIKKPQRSIFGANVFTIVVSAVIGLWTCIALIHLVGEQWLRAAGMNELVGGVPGYKLPYSSSYMVLSWVASQGNWFVAVCAFLGMAAVIYLEVTLSVMGMGRIMFAWGMDRMGPKWFTDVNARIGAPLKNYVFGLIVMLTGTALYVLWFTSALTGLAATGMQLVSVFLITGISAIVLPNRKKLRGIWDSSPFKSWTIAGIPVLTISGVIYVVYISAMVYYAFIDSRSRDVTGKNMITFAVAWAVGIVWWVFWRQWNARAGIDTSLAYGELPPD